MKIDRKNPKHWLYLVISAFWVGLAIILRPVLRSFTRRKRVLLYGHKLHGNLLALSRHLEDRPAVELEWAFLTLDPTYHRELEAQGAPAVSALSWRSTVWLSRIDALISDHGLHALSPLLRASNIQFFDVWHGIPFKGFDADDFRLQRRYQEVWVASDLCRSLYVEKFGFESSRVVATGYARTDRLINPPECEAELRASLGLPEKGRLILFAPTWKQDASGRSLYPFGCAEDAFLNALALMAARYDASIVLRTHLNSGDVNVNGLANVHSLPGSRYPDAEAILLASNMMICDWSSIAFDFLLLDRPTFFLDVEPPFRKGFSLGPEYRFGKVIGSLHGLLDALERTLVDPEAYWQSQADRHRDIKRRVYGDLADGNASERCLDRLRQALG